MATLLQIYDVRYTSTNLRKRITGALGLAAAGLLSEPSDTPNRANRVAWANRCLQDTAGTLERIMWRVALDPVVGEKGDSAADWEIQLAITQIIEAEIASL